MMLIELENYARVNKIPIMQKEGIEFLGNYIKDNNIKTVLEIGSAIGYSAIKMALVNNNIKVWTIEKDNERYQKAVENINKFNLDEQITVINADALEVEVKEKYDLIFIDAAKSQYIKFFNKFKNNLNDNGVIISDNLAFHGLVTSNEQIASKNLRNLVNKIRLYIDFLKNNSEYITVFYDVGDGIAVSKKVIEGENYYE